MTNTTKTYMNIFTGSVDDIAGWNCDTEQEALEQGLVEVVKDADGDYIEASADETASTFIITEKQNVNSFRDGITYIAKTLRAAKCKASREQFFNGTVMTIEDAAGKLISYKKNGRWIDTDYLYI